MPQFVVHQIPSYDLVQNVKRTYHAKSKRLSAIDPNVDILSTDEIAHLRTVSMAVLADILALFDGMSSDQQVEAAESFTRHLLLATLVWVPTHRRQVGCALHHNVDDRDVQVFLGLAFADGATAPSRDRNDNGRPPGPTLQLTASEAGIAVATITVHGEQTKSRIPIVQPLPPELAAMFAFYHDTVRPLRIAKILAAGQVDTERLVFCSSARDVNKAADIYSWVLELTQEHVGRRVTMQRFRHSICTAMYEAGASPAEMDDLAYTLFLPI